jgi:hypothetical protein
LRKGRKPACVHTKWRALNSYTLEMARFERIHTRTRALTLAHVGKDKVWELDEGKVVLTLRLLLLMCSLSGQGVGAR